MKRLSSAWLRRTQQNICKKVGYLITETKSHHERLFCLKNVVATCKYVFSSNFITNCPTGQRLGNDGAPRSRLGARAAAGGRGGGSPGARRGWARGQEGLHWIWAAFPARGPMQAVLGSGSRQLVLLPLPLLGRSPENKEPTLTHAQTAPGVGLGSGPPLRAGPRGPWGPRRLPPSSGPVGSPGGPSRVTLIVVSAEETQRGGCLQLRERLEGLSPEPHVTRVQVPVPLCKEGVRPGSADSLASGLEGPEARGYPGLPPPASPSLGQAALRWP